LSVTTIEAGYPSQARPSGRATSDAARLHPLVWLYLIAVIIPFGFNLGSVTMTGLRLLLLITIVPTTLRVLSGQCGRVYPVDILFGLHVIWCAIALTVTSPQAALENVGATTTEFLGGYMLARSFIRTRGDMIALIRALLILVLLSMPLALAEARSGVAYIPKFIDDLPVLNSVAQVNIPKRMGLERAQVFFAHPIHYGLFCSLALSMTYVGLRGLMFGAMRFVNMAAIFLGVFLSLSSGALLASLLQIGLIAWSVIFRKYEKRWLYLVLLFATAYVAIDLLSNRTPIKVLMSYATFSAHTAYWRGIIFEWGMLNVRAHPIFGLGFTKWVRPGFVRSGSVDNFWLATTMRYGIPGFLFLAAGYLDAILRVGRKKIVGDERLSNLRLAWMITFTGLSFTLATVHIWTAIYSLVFFMLAAGLWIAEEPVAGLKADLPGSGEDNPPKRSGLAWAREEGTESARPLSHNRTGQALAHRRTHGEPAASTDAAQASPAAHRYTRFPSDDDPAG
jgi:hypothetical protein